MNYTYLLGKSMNDIVQSYFIKKQNKKKEIHMIGGNGIIDINKSFTIDEIKKHNTPNDAWILLKIKDVYCVYDVTKWISEHPGGPEVLISHLGMDATENFETIGHPNIVYETLLPKFFIGFLKK